MAPLAAVLPVCTDVTVRRDHATGQTQIWKLAGHGHGKFNGPFCWALGSGRKDARGILRPARQEYAKGRGYSVNSPRLLQLVPLRHAPAAAPGSAGRSEEHTSELQSLMRIS